MPSSCFFKNLCALKTTHKYMLDKFWAVFGGVKSPVNRQLVDCCGQKQLNRSESESKGPNKGYFGFSTLFCSSLLTRRAQIKRQHQIMLLRGRSRSRQNNNSRLLPLPFPPLTHTRKKSRSPVLQRYATAFYRRSW